MPMLGCGAEMKKLMDVSDQDVATIEDVLKERMGLGIDRATAQRQAVEEALAHLADERSLVMKAVKEQLGYEGPTEGGPVFSNKRQDHAWEDREDTPRGPVYGAKDFNLTQPRKLRPDELHLGHEVDVVDTPYRWVIADRNDKPLGTLVGEVDNAGKISAIHDIDVTAKQQGLGTKVVAAIAASTREPVRILEALPQSQGFWDKVGAGYYDPRNNTTLDWSSFARSVESRAGEKAPGLQEDPGGTGVRSQADDLARDLGFLFANKPGTDGTESDSPGLRGDTHAKSRVFDTPAPVGDYHVRTVVGTETKRTLGARSVNSFADVAAATSYLYKSAVERFDGVVTDAQGKPLAVIGGFKGALNQAAIYPGTLVAEAVRIPGAAKVWFSHNHPSGNANLSHADHNLEAALRRVFEGSGIEPMGLIAVAGSRFNATDGTSGDIVSTGQSKKVPVVERGLSDQNAPQDAIGSPQDAKALAQRLYDQSGGPGLMLLNAQNALVGWMPLPSEFTGRLRYTGGLNALYRAASESNAGAVIAVHKGELDAPVGSVTASENIMAGLAAVDVRALDTINVATGKSRAEQGLHIGNGPVFANKPIWKSDLADSIDKISAKVMPPGGWRDAIKGLVNKGSAKAAEVEWSGINDWLDLQQGKVTKEQVAEFLRGNGVQVQETQLGGKASPENVAEQLAPEFEKHGYEIEYDRLDEGMVYTDPDGMVVGFYMLPPDLRRLVSQASEVTTEPKYGKYTLPGGENYREVLLTLPRTLSGTESARLEELNRLIDAKTGPDSGYGSLPDDERRALRVEVKPWRDERTQLEHKNANYQSRHWDQPNVLAHIRLNDRTDADGKRVLFVEELQSDWAQEGRKRGFGDRDEYAYEWFDKAGNKTRRTFKSEAARERYADSVRELADWDGGGATTVNQGVSPAPFISAHQYAVFKDGQPLVTQNKEGKDVNHVYDNPEQAQAAAQKHGGEFRDMGMQDNTQGWLNLALKRVIKLAVDEGYDRVAFVNGEQSADRYDLSKQVAAVKAEKNMDGSYSLRIKRNERDKIFEPLKSRVPESELPDAVGKDLAERIANDGGGTYSGLDLQVGGEGMRVFYDKIVPAAVNKLLPKLGGGRLGDVAFPGGKYVVDDGQGYRREYATIEQAEREQRREGNDTRLIKEQPSSQPGFDITDSMREKAEGGMPMFANRPNQSPWRDDLGRLKSAPGAALYQMLGKTARPFTDKLLLTAPSVTTRHELRQMKLDLQKAMDTAATIAEQANRMTADERKMISDVIEQEVKSGVVPSRNAVETAAAMVEAFNNQADELVRLGMITQETSDRWRGKYLPRFYEKANHKVETWADVFKLYKNAPKVPGGMKGDRLRGRGIQTTIWAKDLTDWEAKGWEVRDQNYKPGDETVQVWRDFTPQEREKMGEIRDAGFRFVMGYMQTQKDIALGRMYERISQDSALSSKVPKDDWVQVPTTRVPDTQALRFGKLAGLYVSKDMMMQLDNFGEMESELFKLYKKGLSLWKEGKTVLNPTSHMNNAISNMTMAHFAGVSYWDVHKYAAAARDLATAKTSPGVKEAREAGLFLGGFTDAEIQQMLPPDLQAMVDKQDSRTTKALRMMYNILTFGLRKNAAKAYQFGDTFFKYMLYQDARAQGLDPQAAVDHALEYIFNYDDLPKGAQRIRDFGIPFFAYTYKAIPALTKTALEHPLRFGLPMALISMAGAASYAIAAGGGGDEPWWELAKRYVTDPEYRAKADEMREREYQLLPEWMKGRSALATLKQIRLWDDKTTGLPVFLDLSRWIPGGDLMDVNGNAGGIPWMQPFTPGSPILSLYAAMFANKDTFTGKELVDQYTDDSVDAAKKRAGWLYRLAAPAIAVGNYHWSKAVDATANALGREVPLLPDVLGGDSTGVDRQGIPVQPAYAAANIMGVKARPMDLDVSEQIQNSQKAKTLRELDARLRQARRFNQKGAMSDRAYDKRVEDIRTKMDRVKDGLTLDGNEKN